jgi:hypothetical protein
LAGKDYYQKHILRVKKESQQKVVDSDLDRSVIEWIVNHYGLESEGIINARQLCQVSPEERQLIQRSWKNDFVQSQSGSFEFKADGFCVSSQRIFFPLSSSRCLILRNTKRVLPAYELKLINSMLKGDNDLIDETLKTLLEEPNPKIRTLNRQEIKNLAKDLELAAREIYAISLGLTPIPDAEKMVVTFSTDTEFEFDQNGNITGLKSGSIIGTIALAELRYDTTPFVFTGFDQDSTETGEKALNALGVSMDQCLECGTLATHPFSRGKLVPMILRKAAEEVKKAGRTYGVMVTHRAMEKIFKSLGIDFQIIDPEKEFRDDPKDKEKIRKWCDERLDLRGENFELWWDRYINNIKLSVKPYLINADSVLKALTE